MYFIGTFTRGRSGWDWGRS